MRVALYIRVSTEEQAVHGLSVDDQKDSLKKWAEENKHKVVDYGFNVSVFEVYLRDNGEARAVYDGRAIVDFKNKNVIDHTVGYGSFDKEHADYFLKRMLEAQ